LDPYKHLAEIIAAQAQKKAQSAISGIPCELGTITASGLKLDTFKHEIQDYLVAEWAVKISLPSFNITGAQIGLKDGENRNVTGTATFSFDPAEIDGVKAELKPDLQPGDRVLAVPVNGGQDAVVICKVVSNA